MRIGALVVDDACTPLPGAVVEFWHCDADGDYSAYTDGAEDPADDEGAGTTFLRGTQTANAEGIVEFATIYPGWYTGRAVHIHTRVHLGDATVVTTQLYFPDELNHAVFASAPYHGDLDTTDGTDVLAGGDPADWGAMFTVTDDPEGGKRARVVLAVDPDARSAETGFMTPPAGPPPAG